MMVVGIWNPIEGIEVPSHPLTGWGLKTTAPICHKSHSLGTELPPPMRTHPKNPHAMSRFVCRDVMVLQVSATLVVGLRIPIGRAQFHSRDDP